MRTYTDEMLDTMQTQQDGIVDISVLRDHFGKITSIKDFYQGDKEFDRRTKEMKRSVGIYEATIINENAVISDIAY